MDEPLKNANQGARLKLVTRRLQKFYHELKGILSVDADKFVQLINNGSSTNSDGLHRLLPTSGAWPGDRCANEKDKVLPSHAIDAEWSKDHF